MGEMKPGHYYDIDGNEAESDELGVTAECVGVICRRLVDFKPNTIPASGAIAPCVMCGEPVVYNPAGPHQDAPRVCLQCAGIEPV